ncbi:GNAT family N-acetyltransferase [Candidatus Methylobacter oryzae]|uniref:GNAT family N-acetyltransferase n=1 Tax=Candidatus Methylobacter oryzae TaxID=2497749 RepID=A0ABY3C4Q4_9GAMM|nr:GNAT family N-acetyltransferase [Candidatus Methylobacter oryzae]TRW89711.1 GNAT family N-acetyltransferase [Candidatus Methylobacter oryzae]
MLLRPLNEGDRNEYAVMLHRSFNTWYRAHGWPSDYFKYGAEQTGIFLDVYNAISPGSSVAAFDSNSGKLMGACFFHPREHHVSLGIMSVNPDYFQRRIGRALVDYITGFADSHRYAALRLVSSAMNMDSFSLYNRSGFIPRASYQDMVLPVPIAGLQVHYPLRDRVRYAVPSDVSAMAALEMEVSGISRINDYRYAIENPHAILQALVFENSDGVVDGFMISIKHPALHMLGPCVARSEKIALALLLQATERFQNATPLFIVPVDKRELAETLYAWGARNVEIHLLQVRGKFQAFNGVNLPSFLPETG